jgi:peptide deformylase
MHSPLFKYELLMKNNFLQISIILLLVLTSCSATKKAKHSVINENGFSESQKELIMSGDTITPMRVFSIDHFDDSILLRTKSEELIISKDNKVLTTLVKRMLATVQDSLTEGVGIAAPQVGILKRVIYVQRFDKENYPFEVYLNPRILKYSELKQPCMEGCLSIPDIRGKTQTRAYAILLEYYDLKGEYHIEMIEDFTSVIFQHETDHLDGILFTDRLDSIDKAESIGKN